MKLAELGAHSYVPYSNCPVLAVVESTSGDYFLGVRVENAVFPLTISAVQNALFCSLSEGFQPKTLYIEKKTTIAAIDFWEKTYSLTIGSLENLSNPAFFNPFHPVKSIKEALVSLLDTAMADESHFPVSALLQTDEGFISGVNIESRPWSRGLCAERVALAKALTYGINTFQALHVCTQKGEYGSPCGACRQVLLEHLPHHPVYLHQPDGTVASFFSSDLLPYSFQFS